MTAMTSSPVALAMRGGRRNPAAAPALLLVLVLFATVTDAVDIASFEDMFAARVRAMSDAPPVKVDGDEFTTFLHVHGPPVVITSVAPGGNAEAIQLMNTGREVIRLDGWSLRDGAGNAFTFASPHADARGCPSVPLKPGETITLRQHAPCSFAFGLSAKKDSLKLFNAQGNKVSDSKRACVGACVRASVRATQ